jgi:3-dehydroquinate synthase
MLLNYGHTVGHALEAAAGYGCYLHGEAVSVGMMGAVRISQRVGLIDTDVVQRQRRLLEHFGLPTACPGVEVKSLTEAMARDKKVTDRAIRWVLLEGLGKATVRHDVPSKVVEEVLTELTG